MLLESLLGAFRSIKRTENIKDFGSIPEENLKASAKYSPSISNGFWIHSRKISDTLCYPEMFYLIAYQNNVDCIQILTLLLERFWKNFTGSIPVDAECVRERSHKYSGCILKGL